MKLKLDANGNAILQDGKPVYVHDDGKEIVFDAKQAFDKIAELNRESATHRTTAKDLSEKLKAFDELDPKAARAALATLEKIDQKALIDAGKVDEVKKQLVKQQEETSKAYEEKVKKLTESLAAVKAKNAEKEIRNSISTSKVMSKLHDSVTPDFMFSFFGKDFKVEEINGKEVIVGQVNDQPIMSRQNPGESASFDEALEYLIERYPLKDRILKGSDGGSGSAGNASGGVGVIPGDKVHGMSLEDYNAAAKAGKIKVAA